MSDKREVEERKFSLLKLPLAGLCLILDTLYELHMLLAQMDWLKNEQKFLEANLFFLHNTPENWSIQIHLFAYSRKTQALSHLHVSLLEITFHTQPRIALSFQRNFSR